MKSMIYHEWALGTSAFVILFALCFLGWYFGSTPIFRRLDHETLSHTIDMRITQVYFEQYDEHGELLNRVITPELTHIPSENTFFLTTPDIHFRHDDSSALWHLQAKEAQTQHGTDKITFKKEVVLEQPQTKTSPGTTLHTSILTYDMKQHKLSTQEGVIFNQGKTHLESNSVNAILDEKHHPQYAIARAAPLKRVHFSTQPSPQDPLMHAYSNTMEYLPLQHLIVLTGEAKLSQGKRLFSAPLIRYNTLKHQVISLPEKESRTHIIFYPDKKHA